MWCVFRPIFIPQIREYERASTTVINASLIPVVDRYLDRLEQHLSMYSDRLLVMQSNGGIMSSEVARQKPAYMIESGPAAGVLAAARLAKEVGLDKVLSFDMGGTTAKACLIENGIPAEKAAGEIGSAATSPLTNSIKADMRCGFRRWTSSRSEPAVAASHGSTMAARCASGRTAPALNPDRRAILAAEPNRQ